MNYVNILAQFSKADELKRTVGIVTRTCSQVFPDSYLRPHFTLRIPLEDLYVASKKKQPPVPDLHNLKGR